MIHQVWGEACSLNSSKGDSTGQPALPTWQKVTDGESQLSDKSQDEAAQAGAQKISFTRQGCFINWSRRARSRDGREGKEIRRGGVGERRGGEGMGEEGREKKRREGMEREEKRRTREGPKHMGVHRQC